VIETHQQLVEAAETLLAKNLRDLNDPYMAAASLKPLQ